jgi:hypothetical protein
MTKINKSNVAGGTVANHHVAHSAAGPGGKAYHHRLKWHLIGLGWTLASNEKWVMLPPPEAA